MPHIFYLISGRTRRVGLVEELERISKEDSESDKEIEESIL